MSASGRRRRALAAAWIAALPFGSACAAGGARRAAPSPPPHETQALQLGAQERLLVLAPHPDDESLGAGGLVAAVIARGGAARVLTLTAGDGYPEAVTLETGIAAPQASDFLRFGARRIGELRRAVAALGGGRARSDVLGFPDGALSLLVPPRAGATALRSPSTGAERAPYAEALVPGAPYDGETLRELVVRALDDFAPTLVALPVPRDQHPDHASTGRLGLDALARREARAGGAATPPRRLFYVVHWNEHPDGWPRERSADETASLALAWPSSLPVAAGSVVCVLALSPQEIAAKRAGILAHASQQAMMGAYLRSFARASEPYEATRADCAGGTAPPDLR